MRDIRFKLWQIILFGIICSLLSMSLNSWASFNKTSTGLVGYYGGANSQGSTLVDYVELVSGNWTTSADYDSIFGGYWGAMDQGGGSFYVATVGDNELRFNSEYITLPSNLVLSFYLRSTALSATSDTFRVIFRYQDPSNYYDIKFVWDSDAVDSKVQIRKVVSGTPTVLSEGSWSPNTNEIYAVSISAIGTSFKVYIREIALTLDWDVTNFWNNSPFINLGTAVASATDSTYSNGQLR